MQEPVFLRACRGESVDHVPVWFMRQAGRSLPEYRALRSTGSILEAIADPKLACEVTLQPVRRYGWTPPFSSPTSWSPITRLVLASTLSRVAVPLSRGPSRARAISIAFAIFNRRRRAPRHRHRGPSAPRTRTHQYAPHWLRGCALHGRELPRRRCTRRATFAVIKTLMHHDPALFDQALRSTNGDHDQFPARASGARRARGAALRLVGRFTDPRRVRTFALPATKRVLDGIADLRRALHPLWRRYG